MDELIYSFLLQSNYPRASIVFDMDLLSDAIDVDDRLRAPSFVIVDPETADLLAVIKVVDAVDGEALREAAIATGAFASRLAGRLIQGFLIRVDLRGLTEEEQAQFYRIWPNSTLQRLSSKSFPDLETLRVARKLVAVKKSTPAGNVDTHKSIVDESQLSAQQQTIDQTRPGPGLYFPAFVLVLLVLIESFLNVSRGSSLLSLTQGILVFGAAMLLSLPAALRYLRR